MKWARTAYARASPTLDQLAAFDRPHRTAIFTAIAPEARAALWREQIRRFAARESLTPSQRALVDDTTAQMTPQLYAQNSATRAKVGRQVGARAKTLFTREQLAAWRDLAGPASGARPARPLADTAQLPWCQCSSIDPWPECSAGCVGAACRGFGPGCGTGGFFDCDGMCL